MYKLIFFIFFPVMIFAAGSESDIYRIASTSVKVNGKDHVDGTLLGYKKHISNGVTTFASDINYTFMDDNTYGIEDTAELMGHIGVMATDDFEIFGSFGYALEGSSDGWGWGFGLVYSIGERVSLTYEYRDYDMDNYSLKNSSIGLLIGL